MSDLLNDETFLKLEKEYKLLSRVRNKHELDKLSYVIVDIETTGLDPTKTEIIEIGAIKTDGTKAVDVFNSLVMPEHRVPEEITRITGISQDMVEGKPGIKEVLEEFLEFSKDHVFVAHNADFDLSFIKYQAAKHLKKEVNNKVLCTVKLSRAALPGLKNYKLHTVAEHLGITIFDRHRAMGDVEATYQLWNKLIEALSSKGHTTIQQLEPFLR